MPEGFGVQLDKLEIFKTHVNEIAGNYNTITKQLAEADLEADPARKESLLCDPVHHTGPPNDFAESCQELVDNVGQLLERLRTAHNLALEQTKYVVTALAETHALYAEIDDRHANLFNNLLKSFEPDQGEDGYGAAR